MTTDLTQWASEPDTPIACMLTPGEHQDRTAELSALAARALCSREAIPRGERLTFRGAADVEAELRAAVAAEASCCAFLTMDLARRADALVLDITGPEDARPIVAQLFAA